MMNNINDSATSFNFNNGGQPMTSNSSNKNDNNKFLMSLSSMLGQMPPQLSSSSVVSTGIPSQSFTSSTTVPVIHYSQPNNTTPTLFGGNGNLAWDVSASGLSESLPNLGIDETFDRGIFDVDVEPTSTESNIFPNTCIADTSSGELKKRQLEKAISLMNNFKPDHSNKCTDAFTKSCKVEELKPQEQPAKKKRRIVEKDERNDSDSEDFTIEPRFREYQSEQWAEKIEELCDYVKKFGHCQVPTSMTNRTVQACQDG